MAKVIGIDLGTTNSVAAFMENGKPKVIPNAEGGRLTPSVVALTEDGRRLVGQLAKRQAVANPEKTVASIKRRMGSDFKVNIDGKKYTPQEISSLILSKVKADAESYLGEKVEKAVITVPAYFNDSQRQATKDAGTIAGLDVIRIINEPTASALAYGLDRKEIHYVLVWDLGGGTFDVSVLELGQGIFEVKAVNGNTWLGGDDWDQRIVDYLAREFQRAHGIDLRKDMIALGRLKEAAEKAKVELSNSQVVSVKLPFIFSDDHNAKDLDITLTGGDFEALTRDLLEKMVAPTKQALADAKLEPEALDRVILVGGATRMPAVQQLCRELLGQEPYRDIDPDEVVALGAAIQAGMLSGELERVTLLDVTPLSLGVETRGGIFARIIERNAKIPTSASQIFSTAFDNQPEVDIHVLQGEREMAAYNMSLGKFQLTGIPLAPRGVPRIEVAFSIDVNGILQVSAVDLYTDNEAGLRVESSRPSSEEMGRMIQEAKAYAEEDKRRREEVEIGIKADNMLYAAERIAKQAGAALQELETRVLEVKAALASGDSQLVKSRTQELQELVKELYTAEEVITHARAT
ncbi:MAG: molecular chaperone DnaK [Chloroflexi bacterium CG07_land_8_20_14_0_80_51_10]|nr:MAG: molecular chaperone DnaK [Chloroflexi bacterium CG07_land_8_20_14_0_80_51_10]